MTLGDQALTKAQRKAFKKERKRLEQQHSERQSIISKLIYYAVGAIILGVIGWFIYQSYLPIPAAEKIKPLDRATPADWVIGNQNAPVVLIEYSDFQCPACKAYASVVSQLGNNYHDRLLIVYRHFPLKTLHLQATLAAQVAEAAGKQGKFWEMHDKLFDTQADWAEKRDAKKYFLNYAESLGLNLTQFKQDLGSKPVRALVQADYESGIKERINSTPTFFLNGERIQSPQGYAAFAAVIETQLRLATSSAQPQN